MAFGPEPARVAVSCPCETGLIVQVSVGVPSPLKPVSVRPPPRLFTLPSGDGLLEGHLDAGDLPGQAVASGANQSIALATPQDFEGCHGRGRADDRDVGE